MPKPGAKNSTQASFMSDGDDLPPRMRISTKLESEMELKLKPNTGCKSSKQPHNVHIEYAPLEYVSVCVHVRVCV